MKALRDGTVDIDPLDEQAVGPASVDLRLGDRFRVFTEFHTAVEVTPEANYEEVTERIRVEESLLLLPGQSVLGITHERIRLAPELCGWLEGRSRFARLGLTIHSTAGFVQPGVNSRQVLEMSNVAPIPLELRPGIRVCQLILEEMRGEATYHGRFENQMEP